MSTNTQDLAERIGPVAAQEFADSPEWAREKLAAWIDRLPGLSDDELWSEATDAIFDSALAQRFRGNWEHDHCRASAVYFESCRRLKSSGHSDRCGDSIYQRAYNDVVRSQGHHGMVRDLECTCESGVLE